MLAAVSTASTSRFKEARSLLTEIARMETPAPQPDTEAVMVMRGLFFVHLYGAFEYSISLASQTLLQEISTLSVRYVHLESLFYAVALDAKFTSLEYGGAKTRWANRVELLQAQKSSDACGLNDTVFQRDLQNVWYATLKNLFDIFCVSEPVLPDLRYKGYIDEVVNKRNAIAHGRESPTIAGRTRASELELRFDAVSRTAAHIIICFDKHLTDRGFVIAPQRRNY